MKNNIQTKLGKRIQMLRKIKGFSQEVFAEKINIATTTLSSIETGNAFMTSQTLENILETLQISPQELFTFSDDTSNEGMMDYVLEKLKFVKDDSVRLRIIYNVMKSL